MSQTTERRCDGCGERSSGLKTHTEAESSAGMQLLHGRTATDCNGLKHAKSGGSEQVKP